jgi:RNA polymerase subunit RPABC4/transcription elongation factor Spt4
MSGCVTCGRPTPQRKCRTCEIEARAEERAESRDYDHPECPTCGRTTSGEGIECYRCRRGDRVEVDGGREECPRCGYLLENTEADCPYCGADPSDTDDGDEFLPDGGSVRGLEADREGRG